MSKAAPYLACPGCGDELIIAHKRGRFNSDGDFVEHKDSCMCRWCTWTWFDDEQSSYCKCGVVANVFIDNGSVYAIEVNPQRSGDWK